MGPRLLCGEGFDTGLSQVGAWSLSLCVFVFAVVRRFCHGFSAGFPTLPTLIEGLCCCGGVPVNKDPDLHRFCKNLPVLNLIVLLSRTRSAQILQGFACCIGPFRQDPWQGPSLN